MTGDCKDNLQLKLQCEKLKTISSITHKRNMLLFSDNKKISTIDLNGDTDHFKGWKTAHIDRLKRNCRNYDQEYPEIIKVIPGSITVRGIKI